MRRGRQRKLSRDASALTTRFSHHHERVSALRYDLHDAPRVRPFGIGQQQSLFAFAAAIIR